jgi:hypothetical protein
LRLLGLEVGDLLVLLSLGGLVLCTSFARVVRNSADNGGACERPSSHHGRLPPSRLPSRSRRAATVGISLFHRRR